MKKRVPALVLALALALTVPAWAAQDTRTISSAAKPTPASSPT